MLPRELAPHLGGDATCCVPILCRVTGVSGLHWESLGCSRLHAAEGGLSKEKRALAREISFLFRVSRPGIPDAFKRNTSDNGRGQDSPVDLLNLAPSWD